MQPGNRRNYTSRTKLSANKDTESTTSATRTAEQVQRDKNSGTTGTLTAVSDFQEIGMPGEYDSPPEPDTAAVIPPSCRVGIAAAMVCMASVRLDAVATRGSSASDSRRRHLAAPVLY